MQQRFTGRTFLLQAIQLRLQSLQFLLHRLLPLSVLLLQCRGMFCVPIGLLCFFAFSLLLRLEQLRSHFLLALHELAQKPFQLLA